MAINTVAVVSEVVTNLTSALVPATIPVGQLIDYPPLELRGLSPVLSIEDAGVVRADRGSRYSVMLDAVLYINRRAHGADGAESSLRTLRDAIMAAVEGAVQGAAYDILSVVTGQRSEPEFAVIDGIPYRIESIPLAVEVVC